MGEILQPRQKQYLEKFNKEEDPLILEMESYAKKFRVPILSGDSAGFLEQLILVKKPKRVLEIGTAIAYSSIRIARNLGAGCTIDTLEKSKDNAKLAEVNILRSGLHDKINLIFGEAIETIPEIKYNYDFIFLDADKEDYRELFEIAIKKLKKGGVMFVDNLLWHGYAALGRVPAKQKTSTNHIRNFNEMFTSSLLLKSTILPVGDGVGIGIKI